MQLLFVVLFFFIWSISSAQIFISKDTGFHVSSGTTIVNHESSAEKPVIYVIGEALLHHSDQIENFQIIKIKVSEKNTNKIKKTAEKKPVVSLPLSSIKNIEPAFHFNANTSSNIAKKNQYLASIVVPVQQQQNKVAHLTEYSYETKPFFYLIFLFGAVLLFAFNLPFRSLRARAPPLF